MNLNLNLAMMQRQWLRRSATPRSFFTRYANARFNTNLNRKVRGWRRTETVPVQQFAQYRCACRLGNQGNGSKGELYIHFFKAKAANVSAQSAIAISRSQSGVPQVLLAWPPFQTSQRVLHAAVSGSVTYLTYLNVALGVVLFG